MAIDLLNIKPHKVSKDLSGYITYIYGAPKTGKTTLAVQMPKALLLAFEKGYNALPGVMAIDITSWGDMKQVMRELKKDKVKETYNCVVVDTIDIAADYCQKYVCNQLGIENIGDGGWTNNGWSRYKKEFEGTFRELAQLGYAIVFISHDQEKTIKLQNGQEYQQICSTVQKSAATVVENMCDIIGYAHPSIDPNLGSRVLLTLRSGDNSIRCGCRFKYMASEIDFSYEALQKALNEAIDREAKETSGAFVTDERQTVIEEPKYDYDALIREFNSLVEKLMTENQSNQVKIVTIVDKYLGKNKKVAETTPAQAELISLIVEEMKTDLIKK